MKTIKILAVDDEPEFISAIKRALRRFSVGYSFIDEFFNFEVIGATSGEAALEVLQKQSIDIVLLDHKLPGLQGLDLLDHISRMNLDLVIIMITGQVSLDLAARATDKGIYDFFTKPFTLEELRSSIENATKHLFLKRMTHRMSEEARQTRHQFLSILSHELKSPLNAIEGYLKIMQSGQSGTDILSYKMMIDRSLVRIQGMRDLITDLLDLTKLESWKKKRDIKDINLYDIGALAVDAVGPMALQKSVNVHFDCPRDMIVQGDREEIEIIFNNLLSNAIKYNKNGGDVHFVINRENHKVVIRVEDTGIGISKEDKNQLFKEFTRIKNAKTAEVTGSGLGLLIVKKMVDLYHGKIQLKTEPEKGSTFTIQLPAESESTFQMH